MAATTAMGTPPATRPSPGTAKPNARLEPSLCSPNDRLEPFPALFHHGDSTKPGYTPASGHVGEPMLASSSS